MTRYDITIPYDTCRVRLYPSLIERSGPTEHGNARASAYPTRVKSYSEQHECLVHLPPTHKHVCHVRSRGSRIPRNHLFLEWHVRLSLNAFTTYLCLVGVSRILSHATLLECPAHLHTSVSHSTTVCSSRIPRTPSLLECPVRLNTRTFATCPCLAGVSRILNSYVPHRIPCPPAHEPYASVWLAIVRLPEHLCSKNHLTAYTLARSWRARACQLVSRTSELQPALLNALFA